MRYLAWAFIALAFAIPGRWWWLKRRDGRRVRWRLRGREYRVRRQ